MGLQDVSLLALLLVTAAWYWRGSRLAKLRAVRARRSFALRRRPVAFYAALVTIGGALSPPMDRLADELFWAHMLQHVLLMLVAPPLIALAAPWMAFWRPLPLALRRRLARAVVTSDPFEPLRRAARWVGSPVQAWLLFDLDLGLWHLPSLFDLTLRSQAVHYVEHASFVLLGILFWCQVIDSPPFHSRLGHLGRVTFLMAGATASWLLAVILEIAPSPLYSAYASLPSRPGGLSPLADQQLAAGVMLGPGSIPFAIAIFYGLYVWLGSEEPIERSSQPRKSIARTEQR
jgi:cytochrome c oxidase assembly factor CtaG